MSQHIESRTTLKQKSMKIQMLKPEKNISMVMDLMMIKQYQLPIGLMKKNHQ